VTAATRRNFAAPELRQTGSPAARLGADLSNNSLGYEKILLVATPLGASLDALMAALREGRFAFSPEAGLPEAARNWPVKTAAAIEQEGLGTPPPAGEGGRAQGLIVLYDLMRVVTQDYGAYDRDPVIRAVLDASVEDARTGVKIEDASIPLAIVTVATPRELLFAQFLAGLRADAHGAPRRQESLSRIFAQSFRRLRERTVGAAPISLTDQSLLLLSIYGSEQRLQQWLTLWSNFVEILTQSRSDVRHSVFAPAFSEDGVPIFAPQLGLVPKLEAAWRQTA